MKTQMVCISGNLVVYKTYTVGQSTIIESAALSDEETRNLFNTIMKENI